MYDDDFKDADYKTVGEIEVTQEKGWFEKALAWCGQHKIIVCCTVIGAPLVLIWLGAKLFAKTKEVQMPPDPTVWDYYQAVPAKKTELIEYDYIPINPGDKVPVKPVE